jgi:hypothetical protein
MGLLGNFFWTIGIFSKAARVFFNEHKEKARAPLTNTTHLNPGPLVVLFFLLANKEPGQYSG